MKKAKSAKNLGEPVVVEEVTSLSLSKIEEHFNKKKGLMTIEKEIQLSAKFVQLLKIDGLFYTSSKHEDCSDYSDSDQSL